MLASSMAALGLPVRQYKQVASWIGEKLSRGKLNGHLLSRSPLSDLVEFEFIATAVLAKRAGFESLRALADVDPRLDAGRAGPDDRPGRQAARLAGRRPARGGRAGVRRPPRRPRTRQPTADRRSSGAGAGDAVEPAHVPRPRQPPARPAAQRGRRRAGRPDPHLDRRHGLLGRVRRAGAPAPARGSSSSRTSVACTRTTSRWPSGSPRRASPPSPSTGSGARPASAATRDPGRGLRLAAAHRRRPRPRASTPTSPRPSPTCGSAPPPTCRW